MSDAGLRVVFDAAAAAPIEDFTLYAAHLVHLHDGRPALLGFTDLTDGEFVGAIAPPLPVRMRPDGTLTAH